MEKAKRKKTPRVAASFGDGKPTTELRAAQEEQDTRDKPLTKTARRRLKREAFLLKLETASQRLQHEENERAAALAGVNAEEAELKVAEMKRALPLIDWDEMGLADDGRHANDADEESSDMDEDEEGESLPKATSAHTKVKRKPISLTKAKEQVTVRR
jgi:hypothetical protein